MGVTPRVHAASIGICRGRFTSWPKMIPGKYCDFGATDSTKESKTLMNSAT